MNAPTRSTAAVRRFDLDWIRVSAFGFLILYHVGMVYVPWWYHVKSTRVDALVPLMNILSPFRLSLLFLVSGAATRFMATGMSPGKLASGRSLRLLVPLIFGMLVVVAPQSYFQMVEQRGYTGSFWEFYTNHYLAFGPQFCVAGHCTLLPTWNHLWFVAYVWAYSLIVAAALWMVPGAVRVVERWLTRPLAGVGVLLLPALLVGAYRFFFLAMFPENTNNLIYDPLNHLISFTMFGFGFLFARSETVWNAMVRWRWWAFGVALAMSASNALGSGYAFMFESHFKMQPIFGIDPASVQPGSVAWWIWHVYRMWAYAFYKWACIVAVLGFGRVWLNRDSPARKYLTDAVFPYYIVHQTAIIAAVHWLKPAELPTGLEATLVIVATAATCAVTYEVVRRINWLRPLFGLKRIPPIARTQIPNQWLARDDV